MGSGNQQPCSFLQPSCFQVYPYSLATQETSFLGSVTISQWYNFGRIFDLKSPQCNGYYSSNACWCILLAYCIAYLK